MVKRGLAVEDDALREAGSVRDVGLEGDVGRDDAARARRAELRRRQGRLEEQERGVARLDRRKVGRDDLLGAGRGVERGGGGRAAGDLFCAGGAVGVLGADGVRQRDDGVEHVVDLKDALVEVGGELRLAGSVKFNQ